ncbi:AzlD domain-containing protein [Microbulbifer elongatus]|uniref:AzlD domain-containing protein n=1 Tax=Microbulbifer elongatus TaxID=86173 RepID=A0ABT1P0T8_9GAMM|nr:AzlD domain-containing protein [Microbulbifer elongatus]MCQ3829720.1 AzlD domain-containing protein [Microbulbifer elongatus]
MDNTLWLALLITAVGTLMLRALPLLWMRRHLIRKQSANSLEAMPSWLTVLGPLMIAAMFGMSLMPATPNPVTWWATAIGILATYLVWRRTCSLGWPVFAGVAVYGAIVVLAGYA